MVVLFSCKPKEKSAEAKPAAQSQKEPVKTNSTVNTNQGEQASIDEELIKAYIAENNLKAERDPSGIYIITEEAGGDAKPSLTDQITAHYHGSLLDGTVFDSSKDRGQPFEFSLGRVVKGWQIGIPKFGKGGKGKLIIPSGLAYGARAAGDKIPANSVLMFDIEVIDFVDPAIKMKEMLAKEESTMLDFIKEKGWKAEKTEAGVYYVIDEPGTAEKPTLQSQVTCHYEGSLLDGSVFDSSFKRGKPATFPLNGVVKGWQEGIPQFGKGGKGTLIIPSPLGYGARGAGAQIPPNSILVFKVEVIDF